MIGKRLPRVDIPAKVTGGAAYVQDLRLPGMVHARVVRPPSYGARLRRVETAAVERMPGVLKVVRDGSFLAVVAEREYQAVTAMRRAGAAAPVGRDASLPDRSAASTTWRRCRAQEHVDPRWPRAASKPAARTLEAELPPALSDARLDRAVLRGRRCSRTAADRVDAHAGRLSRCATPSPRCSRMAKDKVRCIHIEGSGCYGHNGADDVAADAALIARALPGRPVRVQWMREEEHAWEPYGPAMVTQARARRSMAAAASPTGSTRCGATRTRRAPARPATCCRHGICAQPFTPPPPRPIPQPDGRRRPQRHSALHASPTRGSSITSFPRCRCGSRRCAALGAYMNVFSHRELHGRAGARGGRRSGRVPPAPLEDTRARDVVHAGRRAIRLDELRANLPKARGRGFAFARYKNLAAYLAVAVEVEVERETGRMRLLRAVAADRQRRGGQPRRHPQPDRRRHRAVASWTLLRGGHASTATRITSRDWSSYPILRFGDVPDSDRGAS